MPSVISSLKDQKTAEDPWCSATVNCNHCRKQVGSGLKIEYAVQWDMSYDAVLSELGGRLKGHMETSSTCSSIDLSSKEQLASVQEHVPLFWSELQPEAIVDPDSADAFLRRMHLKKGCLPTGSRPQDRAAAPPAKHAKKVTTIKVPAAVAKQISHSKAAALPSRQHSEDRMFMKL